MGEGELDVEAGVGSAATEAVGHDEDVVAADVLERLDPHRAVLERLHLLGDEAQHPVPALDRRRLGQDPGRCEHCIGGPGPFEHGQETRWVAGAVGLVERGVGVPGVLDVLLGHAPILNSVA